MKRLISVLLVSVLLLVPIISIPVSAASTGVIINCSWYSAGINIHFTGGAAFTVSSGTRVNIINSQYDSYNNLIYYVSYQNMTGFVSSRYLRVESTPEPIVPNTTTTYDAELINVKQFYNLGLNEYFTGGTSGTVYPGEKFKIIRQCSSSVYYVQAVNAGLTGYISSYYIKLTNSVQPLNPSSSQRDAIVKIAVNEIGYREGSNDNTKYGAWYGLNYNPWCAMYVSWCASQAGIPSSVVPKHASCGVGVRWFKDRNLWKSRSSGYIPLKGDIIYFDWDYNGEANHVGIVESSNGSIVTYIDGNSSGENVSRHDMALTNGYILGYGTPNYN